MEEMDDIVTLIDEEGNELNFMVIDILEIEGSEYAVLLPSVEEDNDEEAEAVILKFGKDEEGNEILLDIEDDDEWEKVADAWEEINEGLEEEE